MDNVVDTPQSWHRLFFSLLIAVVANIGIWAIVVVMPGIEAEFQSSRAETALPYTLTMIGFGLGNVAIGRVMDRFGITRALVCAGILIGVSFATAAIAHSIVTIAVAHLFLGVGTAVGFGPLIADISHWFRRKRGIAVAIIASGNYLSGAIWPTLLADLLVKNGWRDAYLFLAVLVVTLVVPLAFTLRRRPIVTGAAHDAPEEGTLHIAMSGRSLQWLLGIAGICCCVAMAMPQVHIVAYCVGLSYGPAIGAELLSIMLATGVISRLAFGMLADRLGGVRTVLISSGLQMGALFFFLPFDGLASLYAVSALFGLSQGGIVPSYALVVREYLPAREAGERVGLVMMMTVFGMALGGWLSGLIFDVTASYQMAFVNGIGWNLVNLSIMGWLLFRTGRPPAR